MEVKTQHMEQLVKTKLELELELQTAVELKLKSGAMAEKLGLLGSEADELHKEVAQAQKKSTRKDEKIDKQEKIIQNLTAVLECEKSRIADLRQAHTAEDLRRREVDAQRAVRQSQLQRQQELHAKQHRATRLALWSREQLDVVQKGLMWSKVPFGKGESSAAKLSPCFVQLSADGLRLSWGRSSSKQGKVVDMVAITTVHYGVDQLVQRGKICSRVQSC